MRRIDLHLQYLAYESSDEMEEEIQSLLTQAGNALKNAFAPYSGFKVGAAALLSNGEIILGNNQENVAYPSGLCAERVALFAAHARYPEERIIALAITADTKRFPIVDPVYPCGACRQVMAEYENKQNSPIRVIMGGPGGIAIESTKVADLLPLQFSANALKKE